LKNRDSLRSNSEPNANGAGGRHQIQWVGGVGLRITAEAETATSRICGLFLG